MAANDDEVFMEVIDIDYDEVMPYEEYIIILKLKSDDLGIV